jgi:hypothetical protein
MGRLPQPLQQGENCPGQNESAKYRYDDHDILPTISLP